jgi:hypothetical protein
LSLTLASLVQPSKAGWHALQAPDDGRGTNVSGVLRVVWPIPLYEVRVLPLLFAVPDDPSSLFDPSSALLLHTRLLTLYRIGRPLLTPLQVRPPLLSLLRELLLVAVELGGFGVSARLGFVVGDLVGVPEDSTARDLTNKPAEGGRLVGREGHGKRRLVGSRTREGMHEGRGVLD